MTAVGVLWYHQHLQRRWKIEFTLSAIKESLIEAISASDAMSDGNIDKATLCWNKIQEYLKTHDYIMYADVREPCGVSSATANRILASFV